ncbi:MAG TPA: hypothetical protein DHV12_10375 [Thermotogae bacterium]|nr:hypothetical protein [Thermotogota bacterium]
MFIDVTVISILLTLLCRGNPISVIEYPYRFLYLFPVPLAFQLISFLLPGAGSFFNIASYLMVIALMVSNFHIPGVPYMTIGTVSNTIAVLFGKGRMPVVRSVAEYIGIYSVDAKHVFVETPKEALFLGDITIVYFPWGRSFVVSIGDLLIALGLMVFFLSSLRQKNLVS